MIEIFDIQIWNLLIWIIANYLHYLLPKPCCGVYTALEDRVRNNALLGQSDWIYFTCIHL